MQLQKIRVNHQGNFKYTMDTLILRFHGCEVNGNTTHSHSLSVSMAALPCTHSSEICAVPLQTCCRMVLVRWWRRFTSNGSVLRKVLMIPLKSAALWALLQPCPHALFQDMAKTRYLQQHLTLLVPVNKALCSLGTLENMHAGRFPWSLRITL